MEKEQIAVLVKKAQGGDEGAMGRLIELSYSSVLFQCRKIMAHPEDAEDMAQEVAIKIYQSLDTLREPEKFLSWANCIAARQCINERKRNPKDLQFLEDEEGHSILDTLEDMDRQSVPDAVVDNEETTRMVVELVDGLPDAQRVAAYLYYYDELSVKEIAQMLEVSENTVKSRLNYARKTIKDGVLDYEKKGVKLYGLSPLPFLLYFLRGAAEASMEPAVAAAAAEAALVAGKAASSGLAAGGTAAGGTAAGSTAAGSTAAGGAAAASGTAAASGGTAAAALGGLGVKVVAGVLVGALAIGGMAVVTQPDKAPEPTPIVETTPTPELTYPPIPSYTMERTTVDTGTSGVQIYFEAPRFEEVNEGYRVINAIFDEMRAGYENGTDYNVAYLLEHLDECPRGACFTEEYSVRRQDEDEVYINGHGFVWECFNVAGGSTVYSATFDTLTGEVDASEEAKSQRLEKLYDELEENFGHRSVEEILADPDIDYGNGVFVLFRPVFDEVFVIERTY